MSAPDQGLGRRTLLTGAGLTALAAGLGPALPAQAEENTRGRLIGRARRHQLHVMSFNIRYDRSTVTQPGDPDHWPDREPLLIRLLRLEQPTLLGIQEALYQQLAAVETGLPGHRMIGYGREGGSHGEYSAIFYDPDRLAVLEWDQVWLSDTPRVIGSKTWGNNVTRIVTWARMVHRHDGTEFLAVNTHFDHQSENARVKSAEALVALRQQFPGLPVVLTGDFNSTAHNSGAYRVMVDSGVYRDTWDVAERKLTPAWNTFPGYQEPIEGNNRIDWILVTDEVRVLEAAINTFRVNGRYPSDHTPVQALIEF